MSKKRSAKDPRVVRVMRAIDTVIASPNVDELMLGVLESLLTFGNSCNSYLGHDGWTPTSARATVFGFAMNVPEPLLELLAKVGDAEVKWVANWDRRGWLESQVPGGHAMTLPQLKRAYVERKAAA